MPRASNLDEINEAPSVRQLWAYELGARSAFTLAGVNCGAQLVARHNELSYSDAITDKVSFTFVDVAGNPLRNAANQVRTTRNSTFAEAFAAPGFHDIRVARQVRTQADDMSASSLNLDLTAEFALGPTKHKALTYLAGGRGKNSGTITVWDAPSTLALRPVYSPNPAAQRTNPRPNASTSGSSDPFSWAWGITDQISILSDRVIAAVGARYDDIASVSHNRLNNTASFAALTNWSYRYGIVAKPHRGVALFANHSETFQGGTGAIDSFGNRAPQTIDGVSEEVGVKLDLLDGRLVLTGSFFDMTLKPFTTLEFIPGTSNRILVDRGANRTKGHEIDLAWQAARGLTLIAGYGDLTSRSNTGSRFRHVAEGPNYKIFAKYDLPAGPLKGFAVGGGYSFTPSRAGDAGDTFSLPKYSTVDAFVAYRRGKTAYRLSAINVTDRYLPVVSINRDRITTLDPRSVRASVSHEF
jgi:outer membrane receptor for ferric coprogen and ferric-rhodotorulic acid